MNSVESSGLTCGEWNVSNLAVQLQPLDPKLAPMATAEQSRKNPKP